MGGILLAASFMFTPSLTDLGAEEFITNKSATTPETGFRLKLDVSGSGLTEQTDNQTSENESSKGDRFLVAEGKASYYANRFHGRRTASGEHFARRHDRPWRRQRQDRSLQLIRVF